MAVFNFDVLDDDGLVGTVIGTARLAGDLLNQSHTCRVALAEDGVFAIEEVSFFFSDEKLRAICIGAGIGIGEAAWLIKGEIRQGFILELETDVAGAASGRVAPES